MDTVPKTPKFLKFDKAQLFSFFFFGILLFLLYQLLKILSPFTGAILISGTLALIFYPIHQWVKKRITSNKNVAAAVSTAGTLLTLVLPMLIFGWLLFKESRDIYPRTNQWLTTISHNGFNLELPAQFRTIWDVNVQDVIVGNLKELQESITKSGGKILKNIFSFIISLIVILATLFIFFRDGERFLHWLLDILPMEHEYKYRIANQLYMTTLAIVRGILLTAGVQALVATLGYFIADVPAPVLMGALTFFAALIPFVGTSLVWLPLGTAFMLWKNFHTGLFILLWGGLVVGLLDNVIRPILIGQKAKLPIFLLFLGIFGGIQVYGPIGIFMGPILISCVIVFLQIYREAKNLQPKQD